MQRKKIKKHLGVVTLILFLLLVSIFIRVWVTSGSEYLNEQYGINPVLLTTLMVGAEIAFNLGIVLMIIGSGAHRIRLKDIMKFDFEKVRFSGKLVYLGFLLNRIAALIPPSYVLMVSFGRLPTTVTIMVVMEVVSTLIIGFLLNVEYETKKVTLTS